MTRDDTWRARKFIPHLIMSARYSFHSVIVYIDERLDFVNISQTREQDAVLMKELFALKNASVIDEIRIVERDLKKTKQIYSKVFRNSDTANIPRGDTFWRLNRGLLSYIQAMEECNTEYCAHLDSG